VVFGFELDGRVLDLEHVVKIFAAHGYGNAASASVGVTGYAFGR